MQTGRRMGERRHMSETKPDRRFKLIVATTVLLFGAPAKPAERITAFDVLDKFAATQQKLSSLSIQFEDSYASTVKLPGRKPSAEIHRAGLFRFDRTRYAVMDRSWGDIDPSGKFIQKEDSGLRSDLWDGERFVQYSCGRTNLGLVFLRRTEDPGRVQRTFSRSNAASLMGYFHGSDNRIDSEFRTAKSISLRESLEDVAGSRCYVIDAVTDHGTYTVWIDPQHGYNIAKGEVHRTWKRKDLIYDHGPMMKGDEILSSLANVRFEKIGDVWVPMEADIQTTRNMPRGYYSRFKQHHKRTEVIVDPDHDKLRSFIPDHIKDGAKVYIVGIPHSVNYTWKKGELIPNIDDGKNKGQVPMSGKKGSEIRR